MNLAEALHKGFWLGFLSADDLNALTAKRYGASQHLTSTEHTESGFFDWEAPLIERYFRKGSRILVASAGTGREILALLDAGFSADGFECNPLLLEAGRKLFEQLGQSHSVVFCEPDMVPPGPRIYDGLIIGWGAYTHIPTRFRRVRFLQALRGRTLPHSPLMMSVFIRNESSRYSAMTYRAGAIFRILFRGRKEPLECGDDLEFQLGEVEGLFDEDGVATCPGCVGKVKPDVVLFGELLPESAMSQARSLCDGADLLLCIGSSLEVYPVAQLPELTLSSGGKLAILTQGPTPFDRHAAVRMHGERRR